MSITPNNSVSLAPTNTNNDRNNNSSKNDIINTNNNSSDRNNSFAGVTKLQEQISLEGKPAYFSEAEKLVNRGDRKTKLAIPSDLIEISKRTIVHRCVSLMATKIFNAPHIQIEKCLKGIWTDIDFLTRGRQYSSVFCGKLLVHLIASRRIDDLAGSIVGTLQTQLSKCVHDSLALHESTDQSDTAQLVVFIRGIDVNFNIIEEMLDVCHMKSTSGRDITEHVNLPLEKFNVDRNKINSITTDGAPALTGKNIGFITLFKEMVDNDLLSYNCFIHQQQLCAQKLNMKQLMTDIVNVVNFIRSRGLNHRTF
ncbi:general transcription factor II-I repeat domain-containing protein 2-like [Octopus bimaculoides]|uniref:general transcription factor II-I repeat domain-containing protein 2-like n=1 Tax=Octopus bimaculoides TaxID=37653 RepID=UPI00071CAC88|nr:general transcription factor II-I repeat domain-containing protein 2-like [Octopus bimaculoides]|eukprot:XP_014774790.1 PREDICTED: general transcription factor II-I repeat domain-containing protein 2-like [Octopus bimaculoides]